MKKVIRLTESELQGIVRESVNRILQEGIIDRIKHRNKKKSENDDIDEFYKNADALGLKHKKDPEVEKFYDTADKLGLKHKKND